MRLLAYAPLAALITVVPLTQDPARVTTASQDPSANDDSNTTSVAFAAPPPPRDLHLRFFLEPAAGGARTLLLRDDDDLRLPMGEVKADWACDTEVDRSPLTEAATLEVACGGGALRARVHLAHERGVAQRLTAHSSTGADYTIPRDAGGKLALDPQLVDPAAHDCAAGITGAVDLAVDAVPRAPDAADYEPPRKMRVHSRALPIDTAIDAYAGERCSVERDRADTELVVRCWYPDEPHADVIDVRVRDGALLWAAVDQSPCSGSAARYGGWRLACGTTVRWPRADKVFTAHEYDFSIPEGPSDAYPVTFFAVMIDRDDDAR